MALTCTNSKKVILKYISVIPTKIEYSGFKYFKSTSLSFPFRSGSLDFFQVSAPNADAELSWSFSPNHDSTNFVYDVTVVFASPNAPEPSATFKSYFSGRYSDIGFWYNENGTVYWQVTYGDPPQTQNTTNYVRAYGSFTGYRKVDSIDENATSRDITSISIGGGTVNPDLGYAWKMDIFADGTYLTTKYVRTSTGSPPEDSVSILEAIPGYPYEKEFLFLETSQNIKLVKDESKEYFWQLINSSTGEEIFSFDGFDPELLCFAEESECPSDTCQVDCGDHYCCYKADGHSIYSYSK